MASDDLTLESLNDFPVASFNDLAEQVKRRRPEPWVVQAGAMDGIQFDLLHPHLIKGGWRGLLIEPTPEMFARLRITYADFPQLKLANCAVADHNGMMELHRIDPAAIEKGFLVPEALGITSSLPDRGVLAHFDKISTPAMQQYRQTLEVPCYTLPRLLQDYDVPAMDLVVIDCEGADWMVALQIDLSLYRPLLVCLEFTSLPGDEMLSCCQHFKRHGYTIALCQEDQQNLLFVKLE